MNIILFDSNDFVSKDLVRISGRRHKHLVTVNRVRKDDCLICGEINGRMGKGIVTRITDHSCELRVVLDSEPPEPLPLNLILALPRPKMARRVIQAVTSLGVKQIYLINSWRVEKSFWKSPVFEPEALYQQLLLGLEQGRDTRLPEIHIKRFFKRFTDDELDGVTGESKKIVADPKAQKACPVAVNAPVTLAVGPEGGWIDREIKALEEHGFTPYHMGERILRVETAVPCLISRLIT